MRKHTTNTIELRDKSVFPDDTLLRKTLGRGYKSYSILLELFDKNDMTYEWRYYHDGKAWLCKVQKKKRTIIWMSAWKGYMKATIYFPDKYLEKVYELDISTEMKEKIESTKNVGNSKPCSFEIRNTKVFKDLEKVMMLKIQCK
jgi:hypothetical protein